MSAKAFCILLDSKPPPARAQSFHLANSSHSNFMITLNLCDIIANFITSHLPKSIKNNYSLIVCFDRKLLQSSACNIVSVKVQSTSKPALRPMERSGIGLSAGRRPLQEPETGLVGARPQLDNGGVKI